VRNVVGYRAWNEQKIQEGCTVLLMGRDVPAVVGRINDPLSMWERYRGKEGLSIWVAAMTAENRGFYNYWTSTRTANA